MPKRRKGTPDPKKKWQTFEESVASIQRLFSPGAKVTHNRKIPDSGGRRRQFDVVIEGDVWGRPLLGVMECRDKGRPVDIGQVDGFIAKAESVKANIKIMVSRAGFTEDAIGLAKDHNIGTLSLLPDERSSTSFRMGFQSYATIYSWPALRVAIAFQEHDPIPTGWNSENITYQGLNVVDWFRKYLATEQKEETHVGWSVLEVTFDEPKLMNVDGSDRHIIAIKFGALRKREIKTKFLSISGDIFYDWQEKKWTLPAGGFLYTSTVSHDFSDWEIYDGEVPPLEGPFGLNMVIYQVNLPNNPDVIDLLNI